MSIINFADHKEIQTTPRFIRPMPIQIDSTPFIDNTPVKKKSAAEPLKNVDDIYKVINYFLSTGQYRNNLLFVMGINFGLRCGDLLKIKAGDILINENTFKQEINILEEKTKNTRKAAKLRTCYINDAVMDAAELYLGSLDGKLDLNNYLFTSLSNNRTKTFYEEHSYKDEDAPIHKNNVEAMLKKTINQKLGIDVHAGTHLMRKTYAYHTIMNAKDRTRAIEQLQMIFGHASQSVTLRYAGITDEEIKQNAQSLNLGANSKNPYYNTSVSYVS